MEVLGWYFWEMEPNKALCSFGTGRHGLSLWIKAAKVSVFRVCLVFLGKDKVTSSPVSHPAGDKHPALVPLSPLGAP